MATIVNSTAFSTTPKMDDTFVNVWLDHDEHPEHTKNDFYKYWTDQSSAKHSDPSLVGANALRKLHPKHSLVSTTAYDLNILAFPGLTSTPIPDSPLITQVLFAPLARGLSELRGVLVDQVKFGAFEAIWQGHEFLIYIISYPLGLGTTTHTFILHEGPEDRARLLLLKVGAWSHELHDEVWVFNQGFWNKDPGLWEEIKKADWKDVILKENFKKRLQDDIYGFFKAEEVYKKLSIPWKRGLIMHGPPGNGKTISLKAIIKSCAENGFTPLYVKSFQSWKGEEGAMADVFDQARTTAPSCLVLEDLDSLINDNNRSFFLNQLDGLEGNHGLLIIGTTNHFDRLDPGLSSRPSRFDRKYLFDDPDEEERTLYAKYWQNKLSDNPEIEFPDSLIDIIAKSTSGFSFAYLKEAFVSTLVALVSIPNDKPPFGKLLQEHIHELRKQLDKGEPERDEEFNNVNTQPILRPFKLPYVANSGGDIRALFDSLNDHVTKDEPGEKIFAKLQQQEPGQLDAEAQRIHALLGSLSTSAANINTSTRVYRPFVSPDLRSDVEYGVSVETGEHSGTTGSKTFGRRLPIPPGPSSTWQNSNSSVPTPPGSFPQPRHLPRY